MDNSYSYNLQSCKEMANYVGSTANQTDMIDNNNNNALLSLKSPLRPLPVMEGQGCQYPPVSGSPMTTRWKDLPLFRAAHVLGLRDPNKDQLKTLQGHIQLWDQIKYREFAPLHASVCGEIVDFMARCNRFDYFQLFLAELGDSLTQKLSKDEKFLRALIVYNFNNNDFPTVYKLIENGVFEHKDGLLALWDEAHYREKQDQIHRPLTPLIRFRVRQRHPPPYNICPAGRRPCAKLPQQATAILRKWLSEHINFPYPSPVDKETLSKNTHLSLYQVKTWFANARRRLKKSNNCILSKEADTTTTASLTLSTNKLCASPNPAQVADCHSSVVSSISADGAKDNTKVHHKDTDSPSQSTCCVKSEPVIDLTQCSPRSTTIGSQIDGHAQCADSRPHEGIMPLSLTQSPCEPTSQRNNNQTLPSALHATIHSDTNSSRNVANNVRPWLVDEAHQELYDTNTISSSHPNPILKQDYVVRTSSSLQALASMCDNLTTAGLYDKYLISNNNPLCSTSIQTALSNDHGMDYNNTIREKPVYMFNQNHVSWSNKDKYSVLPTSIKPDQIMANGESADIQIAACTIMHNSPKQKQLSRSEAVSFKSSFMGVPDSQPHTSHMSDNQLLCSSAIHNPMNEHMFSSLHHNQCNQSFCPSLSQTADNLNQIYVTGHNLETCHMPCNQQAKTEYSCQPLSCLQLDMNKESSNATGSRNQDYCVLPNKWPNVCDLLMPRGNTRSNHGFSMNTSDSFGADTELKPLTPKTAHIWRPFWKDFMNEPQDSEIHTPIQGRHNRKSQKHIQDYTQTKMLSPPSISNTRTDVPSRAQRHISVSEQAPAMHVLNALHGGTPVSSFPGLTAFLQEAPLHCGMWPFQYSGSTTLPSTSSTVAPSQSLPHLPPIRPTPVHLNSNCNSIRCHCGTISGYQHWQGQEALLEDTPISGNILFPQAAMPYRATSQTAYNCQSNSLPAVSIMSTGFQNGSSGSYVNNNVKSGSLPTMPPLSDLVSSIFPQRSARQAGRAAVSTIATPIHPGDYFQTTQADSTKVADTSISMLDDVTETRSTNTDMPTDNASYSIIMDCYSASPSQGAVADTYMGSSYPTPAIPFSYNNEPSAYKDRNICGEDVIVSSAADILNRGITSESSGESQSEFEALPADKEPYDLIDSTDLAMDGIHTAVESESKFTQIGDDADDDNTEIAKVLLDLSNRQVSSGSATDHHTCSD